MEDPTKDLPPIFTAEAWVDKPPPQRGEGLPRGDRVGGGSVIPFKCRISINEEICRMGRASASLVGGIHGNDGYLRQKGLRKKSMNGWASMQQIVTAQSPR